MDNRYIAKKVAEVSLGTSCIFCNSQAQAEAVAAVLNKGTYTRNHYNWLARDNRPPSKVVDWWCVYEDKTPWAVIPAWDVKPGEQYFGTYEASYAHEMWSMANRWTKDDPGKGVGFKVGPCDAPGRLAIVQRDIPQTVRGELKDGDTFVYLDSPDTRVIVADSRPNDIPATWMFSSGLTTQRTKLVFRIPHWNQAEVAPAPLPHAQLLRDGKVDQLAVDVERKRLEKVDGVDAAECLWRYENAMHNESLVRTQSGLVSTHGDYGLNERQTALAQELWTLLRKLKARDARRDAVEKERYRVHCEDSSEL